MSVRKAYRSDIPALVEVLKDYSSSLSTKHNFAEDTDQLRNILFECIVGRGFVLTDDDYNGILVAYRTSNFWNPKIIQLSEMAWYVRDPEQQPLLGGRLWLEFNRLGTQMLNNNEIDVVLTSKMSGSTELDYEKRGYTLFEQHYTKGT